MALHRTSTMARLAALLFTALAAGSCGFWDECYAYECVRVYYPRYGYYTDCYAVRVPCEDGRCDGRDCGRGGRRACKLDDDCEPGRACGRDGYCSREPGRGARFDGGTDGGPYARGNGLDASASLDASSARPDGAQGSDMAGAPGSGAASDPGTQPGSGEMQSGSAGDNPGSGSAETASGRTRRFNFPCQRDTQCGPGQCTNGECFNACTLDDQCGTADRCSVETGRRLCMHDPNPEVSCQEPADCQANQTCVDGACHDPCDVDTDCANPQDRCLHNLCFPDRRPMVECVLNLECATGLVCLDGRCVNLDGTLQ